MQGYNHHHTYWPRNAYRGNKISWAFRQLKCHIYLMKTEDHKQLHATTPPPRMPSREYMVSVLLIHKQGYCPQGVCFSRSP